MEELQNIKAGDQVIWTAGGFRNEQRVLTVTRTTATQIICDKSRFSKRWGSQVGDSDRWSQARISLPKPGQIERVKNENRKSELAGQLSRKKWSELSLEQLESLNAALAAVGAATI